MDIRKRKSQKRSTKVSPDDLLAVDSWRAYWQHWLDEFKRYELQLKRMHPTDAGLALMDRVYEQYERSKDHAEKSLGIDWYEMIRTRTKTVPVPENEPDPNFYLTLVDWILTGLIYDYRMLAVGTIEYASILNRAHRDPVLIRADVFGWQRLQERVLAWMRAKPYIEFAKARNSLDPELALAARQSAVGYMRTQLALKRYPDFWAAVNALRLDDETNEMALVRLIEERVGQLPPEGTPVSEVLKSLRNQITSDIRRTSRPVAKQREFERGMLSTDAEIKNGDGKPLTVGEIVEDPDGDPLEVLLRKELAEEVRERVQTLKKTERRFAELVLAGYDPDDRENLAAELGFSYNPRNNKAKKKALNRVSQLKVRLRSKFRDLEGSLWITRLGDRKAPYEYKPSRVDPAPEEARIVDWPRIGIATPERRARIGETRRLYPIRRSLQDWVKMGPYPVRYPFLDGLDTYSPGRELNAKQAIEQEVKQAEILNRPAA